MLGRELIDIPEKNINNIIGHFSPLYQAALVDFLKNPTLG